MDRHDHAELGQAGRVRDRGGSSWLTLFGFCLLTGNTVMALYRSRDDFWSISFVGFSYLNLVLLFSFLRWFERVPESPRRHRMKVAVWLLTTLLTAMFAYKVVAVMPFPVAVLVWAMASATAFAFYAFFIYEDE
ncbi:hypothetical protein BDA96_04G099900 [Sorghum bicolor]|jgi:hypothetical protein|uniref:Uncharacterized protein n=1 Tax=Sorghum bicolor TaxID=4558 RepID=A0A921R3B7_SORBI|nr:hypothetical protein BDA96_04G099900 [Sorghum bicolor]